MGAEGRWEVRGGRALGWPAPCLALPRPCGMGGREGSSRSRHLQPVLSGCSADGRREAGGPWGSPALSRCLSPPPQVCLFFQNQLFRGNRVTKVDSRRFAAFCSPNLPPLAVVGTDVIRKLGGEQGHPVRAPTPGFMPGAGREIVSGAPESPPAALGCKVRGLSERGPAWATKGGAPVGSPSSEPGAEPEEEQAWGTCDPESRSLSVTLMCTWVPRDEVPVL